MRPALGPYIRLNTPIEIDAGGGCFAYRELPIENFKVVNEGPVMLHGKIERFTAATITPPVYIAVKLDLPSEGDLDWRKTPESFLGCFARAYDDRHLAKHPDQLVTAVKLHIYPSPPDPRTLWFSVWIQRRGEHKALNNEGMCRHEGDELRCAVECDGGGVRLSTRPPSSLLMRLGVQPAFGPNGERIKQDERIKTLINWKGPGLNAPAASAQGVRTNILNLAFGPRTGSTKTTAEQARLITNAILLLTRPQQWCAQKSLASAVNKFLSLNEALSGNKQ
jgi:hypothetical protein